jgi:hypothetical protein
MHISGSDIKGLLSQRIIIPRTFSGFTGTAGFDVATGYTDSVIKHFWKNNIGINAQSKRRLDFITIAENKNIGNPNDFFMARFNKLSDVTATLAHDADVVITATPKIEAGTILLDVAAPDDRTVNSDRPLIISLDRKTALQMEHNQETGNYKNAFYATRSGAQFADEALTMLFMRDGENEPEGADRYEEHLNVSVSTPEAGQEYNEMRRQASHMMTNYEEVNTLQAQTNFTQLKHRRDYNAGDIVTVQDISWGLEADIQITAVEVAENAAGRVETVTLGTGEKGYVRKLMTEIKNI